MKYMFNTAFYVALIMMIMISGCKTEKKKLNNTSDPSTYLAAPVAPDECLIEGLILANPADGARIVVQSVKTRGSSFIGQFVAGDTIKVAESLNETGTYQIKLASEPGMGGEILRIKDLKLVTDKKE